ncbi:hypothetical protein [Streptomyces scopuliridis]|uniref:hypothetical protein n=1 Tax=Streptomyces scopuliridis TaxID=452529 RepID=UPI00341E12EA
MNVDLIAVLVPAVLALAGLLLRSRAGSSNLWDVLHELARGRVDAGIERERRATLRMMLERLPKDAVPVEDTDDRETGRRAAIGSAADDRRS